MISRGPVRRIPFRALRHPSARHARHIISRFSAQCVYVFQCALPFCSRIECAALLFSFLRSVCIRVQPPPLPRRGNYSLTFACECERVVCADAAPCSAGPLSAIKYLAFRTRRAFCLFFDFFTLRRGDSVRPEGILLVWQHQ